MFALTMGLVVIIEYKGTSNKEHDHNITLCSQDNLNLNVSRIMTMFCICSVNIALVDQMKCVQNRSDSNDLCPASVRHTYLNADGLYIPHVTITRSGTS